MSPFTIRVTPSQDATDWRPNKFLLAIAFFTSCYELSHPFFKKINCDVVSYASFIACSVSLSAGSGSNSPDQRVIFQDFDACTAR